MPTYSTVPLQYRDESTALSLTYSLQSKANKNLSD